MDLACYTGLHGGESAPAAGSATGPISVAAVRAAAEALVAGAQSLNELDAKVSERGTRCRVKQRGRDVEIHAVVCWG